MTGQILNHLKTHCVGCSPDTVLCLTSLPISTRCPLPSVVPLLPPCLPSIPVMLVRSEVAYADSCAHGCCPRHRWLAVTSLTAPVAARFALACIAIAPIRSPSLCMRWRLSQSPLLCLRWRISQSLRRLHRPPPVLPLLYLRRRHDARTRSVTSVIIT